MRGDDSVFAGTKRHRRLLPKLKEPISPILIENIILASPTATSSQPLTKKRITSRAKCTPKSENFTCPVWPTSQPNYQPNFIVDSGFQSGVSTNAPSLNGDSSVGNSDMEMEMAPPPLPPVPFEMYQQRYTPDQMEDIGQQFYSSRSQRVRAAMFPETMDESTEIPVTQMTEAPTAVEILAEPSQLLKHAVTSIVNYTSDADALRIIPDLLILLQDNDKEVVAKTAHFIQELSKKDASRYALMRDAQVISALVNAMQGVNDPVNGPTPDAIRAAAGTLYNFSNFPEGLNIIFVSYGIPFLIKLLSFPVDSVQNYAITTLHNLIEHQENAKAEIFKHRGIQAMIPLLRRPSYRLVTVVCDCLKYLTLGNQEAKVIILAANGPQELLRIMKTSTYEKLLNTASCVLKAISVEHHNKRAILREGGIEILVNCITSRRYDSARVPINILYILRNLSDMLINDPEFKDSSFDGLLEMLVPMLKTESETNRLPSQVLCAAGILSNLTCNNQRNKMKVVQLQGVELLLGACIRYPQKEEITEPAMCTLRHLTSRHADCEVARQEVQRHRGLDVISGMLRRQESHWTLIKAVVGLTKNMSAGSQNLQTLRELGVVHRLVELFFHSFNLIQQASGNGHFSTNVVFDNVRMHDVVEGCASALYDLAKDSTNRELLRNVNMVNVLVQLLNFPLDNVLRAVTALLSELTTDREGCTMVEQCGATAGLTALLARPPVAGSEPIAHYAASALYNMSDGKSAEFRDALFLQLQEVVGQAGDTPLWGSSEIPADFDYLLAGDAFHNYHSSGPPSVYGTNLSVYEPDTMSGMDMMAPHIPSAQVWNQYSATEPTNMYGVSQASYGASQSSQQSYHGMTPVPDNVSWKDSDV